MKTILAYGDSLTFGSNPQPGGPRHDYEDRWPSVLERGLGGRTTAFDDWTADADRNGARILPTLLASHAPLDLVIIMLGTNDLKPAVNGNALTASYGMRRLVQVTRGHFSMLNEPVPDVLLVAPPLVCATENGDMMGHFGGLEHALLQASELAQHYARRAQEWNTGFFDASTVAQPDPRDGIHLDAANTRAIGEGLVPVVKSMLAL